MQLLIRGPLLSVQLALLLCALLSPVLPPLWLRRRLEDLMLLRIFEGLWALSLKEAPGNKRPAPTAWGKSF